MIVLPALDVDIPFVPPSGWNGRWHRESLIEPVVARFLEQAYGPERVIRQYRGFSRPSGGSAVYIPDLLVPNADWSWVVIYEIKADYAGPPTGDQLRNYAACAKYDGIETVQLVAVAQRFSSLITDDIIRWPLNVHEARA